MKMSSLILMILVTFGIEYGAGLTMQEFDVWEKEWKRIPCELGDAYTNPEYCGRFEPPEIAAAFDDCQFKAFPDSKEPRDFMKAACADNTIFDAYDTCLEEYKKDETYVKKIAELDEAYECYAKQMEEHGMRSEVRDHKEE